MIIYDIPGEILAQIYAFSDYKTRKYFLKAFPYIRGWITQRMRILKYVQNCEVDSWKLFVMTKYKKHPLHLRYYLAHGLTVENLKDERVIRQLFLTESIKAIKFLESLDINTRVIGSQMIQTLINKGRAASLKYLAQFCKDVHYVEIDLRYSTINLETVKQALRIMHPLSDWKYQLLIRDAAREDLVDIYAYLTSFSTVLPPLNEAGINVLKYVVSKFPDRDYTLAMRHYLRTGKHKQFYYLCEHTGTREIYVWDSIQTLDNEYFLVHCNAKMLEIAMTRGFDVRFSYLCLNKNLELVKIVLIDKKWNLADNWSIMCSTGYQMGYHEEFESLYYLLDTYENYRDVLIEYFIKGLVDKKSTKKIEYPIDIDTLNKIEDKFRDTERMLKNWSIVDIENYLERRGMNKQLLFNNANFYYTKFVMMYRPRADLLKYCDDLAGLWNHLKDKYLSSEITIDVFVSVCCAHRRSCELKFLSSSSQ